MAVWSCHSARKQLGGAGEPTVLDGTRRSLLLFIFRHFATLLFTCAIYLRCSENPQTGQRVLILSRKPNDIAKRVLPRRRWFPPPWTRAIASRHALLSARRRTCIRQDPSLASTRRSALLLCCASCSPITGNRLTRPLLHKALAAGYLDELPRSCAPNRS